jgi:ankyrin repeat protein
VYRGGSKKAHREKDEEGCTPLLVAAKCGDEDTFRCLLEHVSQLVVKLMA